MTSTRITKFSVAFEKLKLSPYSENLKTIPENFNGPLKNYLGDFADSADIKNKDQSFFNLGEAIKAKEGEIDQAQKEFTDLLDKKDGYESSLKIGYIISGWTSFFSSIGSGAMGGSMGFGALPATCGWGVGIIVTAIVSPISASIARVCKVRKNILHTFESFEVGEIDEMAIVTQSPTPANDCGVKYYNVITQEERQHCDQLKREHEHHRLCEDKINIIFTNASLTLKRLKDNKKKLNKELKEVDLLSIMSESLSELKSASIFGINFINATQRFISESNNRGLIGPPLALNINARMV